MNLYTLTVPYFDKSLQNADTWIDKTLAFAKTKNFDANDLLTARLAPDQFPLVKQFQSICDQAKFICARTTGKTPPSHPDTEKTWDEIRPRIRAVREYVNTFKPSDFEGAETRMITLPWAPGKAMAGEAYVLELSLPNFGFHLVTAYSILRHNGVELGKMDFLGSIPLKDV
jgi:hypothetical protein